MPANPKPHEPSMDEILDSIRRIMADDDPGSAEASFSRPRPMAPAPRPGNGHETRPLTERPAGQPVRLYGRIPDEAAPFGVNDPNHPVPPRSRFQGDETRGGRPATSPRDGRTGSLGHAATQSTRPQVEAFYGSDELHAERTQDGVFREARMAPPPARAPEMRASEMRAAAAEMGSGRNAAGASGMAQPAGAEDRRSPFARRYGAATPRAASDLPPVRGPVPAREAPPASSEVRMADRVAAPAGAERRPLQTRKDLLSPAMDAAVATAFKSLGDLVLPQQERTVEDLVKEILRPMLKEWLDQNLSATVERLVRAEIERVTRTMR